MAASAFYVESSSVIQTGSLASSGLGSTRKAAPGAAGYLILYRSYMSPVWRRKPAQTIRETPDLTLTLSPISPALTHLRPAYRRFPGSSWQEIEALPWPLRWIVQRAIFHLLDEPVPILAEPFPHDDPLPGAYELHLPADDVTIWYTVTEDEGTEVISGT